MAVLKSSYSYSKVNKEDPDEIIHRRAQFLINKVLEQADSRRKPSFIRIRLSRLKLKIGRKLKKLRKAAMVSVPGLRIGVYKQVLNQMKTWTRLFNRGHDDRGTTIATFRRPLLT
ncbi:Detected protein of confused Function [Hibiscus syriacus]|uniref:Detected protein of confused Function n=1 Tax=Hibiscus syriacus TaxID=106335 RepID=A0A6A2YDV8_HIBSY|nr:uncharacterized protein LOC120174769 [Hibiscus syriacus]KAE8670594.1 Detected protein of confused Function [Hibiscus syriacus]